jgi:hypothetical protein
MRFRRRRPLMGAAMMGGAVMAGRASQRHQTQEQDQDARLDQMEQQPPAAAPAPAPAPAAAAPETGLAAQIQQLATLKEQGVLNDEEFEAGKQKLLAS